MKCWSHKYKIGSKVQIKCGDYEAKAIVTEHVIGLGYAVEIYEGEPSDSVWSEVFLTEI
jgi:hypothetical protein